MKYLLFLLIAISCLVSCDNDEYELKAEKTIQGIILTENPTNSVILDTAKGTVVTIVELCDTTKYNSFTQTEPDGIFHYNYLNDCNYRLVFNYSKNGLIYKDSIFVGSDEDDGKFHTVILKPLSSTDKKNSISGKMSFIDVKKDFQDSTVAQGAAVKLYKGQNEFGELIGETISSDGNFSFKNLSPDNYYLTFNLIDITGDEIKLEYQTLKSIQKSDFDGQTSIILDRILLEWISDLTLLKVYTLDTARQIIGGADICLYSSRRIYDSRDSTCVGSNISGRTNKMGWIMMESQGIEQFYYDGAFIVGNDTLKPYKNYNNIFSDILLKNTLNIDTLFLN